MKKFIATFIPIAIVYAPFPMITRQANALAPVVGLVTYLIINNAVRSAIRIGALPVGIAIGGGVAYLLANNPNSSVQKSRVSLNGQPLPTIVSGNVGSNKQY